jgi:hypothetical protein
MDADERDQVKRQVPMGCRILLIAGLNVRP